MKSLAAGLCLVAFLTIGGLAAADQPPDIDADVLFAACRQKGLEPVGAGGAPQSEDLAKRGRCLEDEIAVLRWVFNSPAMHDDDIHEELQKAARAIADLYGVIDKTQPACRPECEAELVYIPPMIDILEAMLREMIDLRRANDNISKFINTWPEPFDSEAVIADCRAKTKVARESGNRPEAYGGLVDLAQCLEEIIVEKGREINKGWNRKMTDDDVRQRLRDIAIAHADVDDYLHRHGICLPDCRDLRYGYDILPIYESFIREIAATIEREKL